MTLKARIAKVTVEHILAVIDEIQSGRIPVPRRREATKWCLLVSGWSYPSKYVFGRAIEIATPGETPITPRHFSGGEFTKNGLSRILKNDSRFRIVYCARRATP
jgi:hypothetical protein